MENEFESKQGEIIPISELDEAFASENEKVFSQIEKTQESENAEIETTETTQNTDYESTDNSTQESQHNNDSVSEHLSGEIAVNLLDVVVSRVLSFTLGKSGYDVSYRDFKLDANERKSLVKPIDMVLQKYGFGQLSPEIQLGVILVAIYGAKFAVATEKSEERKPRKSVSRGIVKSDVSDNESSEINNEAPYGYNKITGKPRKYPEKIKK